MFFFEKKNQKTFIRLGPASPQARCQVAKVFCFFFSKKKALLPTGVSPSTRIGIMRTLLTFCVCLGVTTAAFAGPAEDAVMQPVTKFIAAINAGDAAAAAASMTSSQSITDEFAPYHWDGPHALSDWFAGDVADMKAHDVTAGSVSIAKPLTLSVTGTHAYAVIPTTYSYAEKGKKTTEKAIFTMSLEKTGGAWLIGSWSYGLE